MSTISKAKYSLADDQICQGDIYRNVKYNYIESEDDQSVKIIEYEFPYAIIISQACDVIAMCEMFEKKQGKATKFMPSILLCPIYDESMARKGEHIDDVFPELSINLVTDPVYHKDDLNVAQRDWHYRFHSLAVEIEGKKVLEKSIVDFKHYFSVPASYLLNHKSDRILHIDDLYAEQITLKFATYLSRVAIP